ncbi:hypothetical protein GW17_00055216 [Ensete ventricosum]|nr:hypothetical protein GW17_00055216 [Ensete ventricosum]
MGGRRPCWRSLLATIALAGGNPGHGATPCGLARAAAPCSLTARAAYARRHQPCPRVAVPAGSYPCKGLWPWLTAPLQGALAAVGLAVGGQPFMGAGHDWPPLLLTTFAVKTQQERIERF